MLKRSVTSSLARALFAIVVLSVLASALALLTLSASLRDAEAINIAGSLRMQSYRLAWDANTGSTDLPQDIRNYQQSVNAPALRALQRDYVPDSVKERYQALQLSWQKLQPDLLAGNTLHYQQQVSHYVAQIDHFVLALQHWAELKMKLVAGASLLGFIAIAALVFWTLRLVRQQVVTPLNQLVLASHEIERANFKYGLLNTALPNELGVLAQAFTHMSGELEKHYVYLEQAVKEKTSDLQQANRRLALLYRCSQMLTSPLNSGRAYPQVLEQALEHADLYAIELHAPPQCQIAAGKVIDHLEWRSLPLDAASGSQAGELRWQALYTEPQLMQGLASMLTRALQLDRAEQKVRHLLLMEERATIARELHDSLAQSLVYLRIQMTRLKRVVSNDASPAQDIVGEIDRALTEANRQLRELLTTFRLSIEPADLGTALQQVVTQLRPQTEAEILLAGSPSQQHFTAQQQVHILQIAREALLNAIRHAGASQIIVHYDRAANGDNLIEIKDNGLGLQPPHERAGHYGLAIMHERAKSLNGQLNIASNPGSGTVVTLQFPPGEV
ncbi:nitrate/nitrite two-component system sensor histidine kinase NarQ [Pantoea sp. BAV 3049]|uniref:nitrate/nitrite two-component system sensor histidine kinase NarQ n=1 Tax=Pantoea sp. BAV 3049 TaxID=2654188 RepID=UPI00131C3EFA|nr:nitrate/nitrite two-component system sensor histidine kinase NarQ [Pantoea sp. BAV 3049]